MSANNDLTDATHRCMASPFDACAPDWSVEKATVWKRTCVLAAAAAVLGIGTTAGAQGQHRAAGPDDPGKPVPSASQAARPLPDAAEEGRLAGAANAGDRREVALMHKAEAAARRNAARENSKREEARAGHEPDEHAAPQAFEAADNAANRELRHERPELQQENRGDHGPDPASDGQD